MTTTTNDDQVELLDGYIRWRRDQANKDPADSPQEYLRFRQREKLYATIADTESSEWAVRGLIAALSRDDLDETLVGTLRDALTVCKAVMDAA